MHDFSCTKPEDIINPVLRERVRYLKKTEGGMSEMCDLMEELMNERAEERVNEEKVELAKKAISRNKHSLEEIAEDFELPLSFIKELAGKVMPAAAKN